MSHRKLFVVTVSYLLGISAQLAVAEPVKIDALVTERSNSRIEFADGSKRYVALIQREGQARSPGLLGGAKVVEFGMHDITPGVSSDTIFYHAFTMTNGDHAYIKSTFRGVTVQGPDGKPKNILNGLWEVVSSSGGLKGLKGTGVVHIKPVSKDEREFSFEGDASLPATTK